MIEKLLCVTLLWSSPALATGKGGASFAATASPTSTSTAVGGGGGARNARIDPRRVPPLDPERKVTEVDCTKPVDLTAGNLRCK